MPRKAISRRKSWLTYCQPWSCRRARPRAYVLGEAAEAAAHALAYRLSASKQVVRSAA